jgi:serine/threonine-protein phosphatase 6 regulatory ankyrin repeat subunit B
MQRRPLSLVTGETGTGKTTLMRALIDFTRAQDDGAKTRIAYSFGAVDSAEDLLAYLAAQLTDVADQFGEIKNADHFISLIRAQFQPNDLLLVIVDEAQELDRSGLNSVLQLADRASDPALGLTIVVSGGTKLERVFNRTFADHASVWDAERRRLHCLNEREVEAFVVSMIRQKGTSEPEFSNAALVRVHRLSSGVIRVVSNLCGNAMFLAYSRGDITVTEEHIEEAAQVLGIKQLDPASAAQAGDWRQADSRTDIEASDLGAAGPDDKTLNRDIPARAPDILQDSVEGPNERQSPLSDVRPGAQTAKSSDGGEQSWQIAADDVPQNLQLQARRRHRNGPRRAGLLGMMVVLGVTIAAGVGYQAHRWGFLDGTVETIKPLGEKIASRAGGRPAEPEVVDSAVQDPSKEAESTTEELVPPDGLMAEIRRLREANDYAAALALLEEPLDADPNNQQLTQLRDVLGVELEANRERQRVEAVVANLEEEARNQQATGNYDAALITVAAALSYRPDETRLTALRDEISAQRQDEVDAKLKASLLAAEERARRAAEVERLQELAESQKQKGDSEGALRSLDAAVALVSGESVVGTVSPSPASEQTGEKQEPAEQAKTAVQQNDVEEIARLVDEAEVSLGAGDYTTAAEQAAVALAKQPEDAELLALNDKIDLAHSQAEEQRRVAAEIANLVDEAHLRADSTAVTPVLTVGSDLERSAAPALILAAPEAEADATAGEPRVLARLYLTSPQSRLEETISESPEATAPIALDPIELLMERARAQFQDRRLTLPEGDSALDTYREVLRQRPGYRAALQGLAQIRDEYAAWAESAASRGDLSKAKRHYTRGLQIDPTNREILDAMARLDTLQPERMMAPAGGDAIARGFPLSDRPEPGERYRDGIMAVLEGDADGLRAELDAGFPPNTRDRYDRPVLALAAAFGQADLVRLLLERGAAVDAAAANGDTALMYAAWYGHPESAAILIDAGADVRQVGAKGRTPLMHAAIGGHLGIAEQLLARDVDTDTRSKGGKTALMAAVWNGHLRMARMLLANGARVDPISVEGWTALMYAAWMGRQPLVQLLLDYGADPGIRNEEGQSVADLAAVRGHGEIVTLLQ